MGDEGAMEWRQNAGKPLRELGGKSDREDDERCKDGKARVESKGDHNGFAELKTTSVDGHVEMKGDLRGSMDTGKSAPKYR
jgi:hypothetical protein